MFEIVYIFQSTSVIFIPNSQLNFPEFLKESKYHSQVPPLGIIHFLAIEFPRNTFASIR